MVTEKTPWTQPRSSSRTGLQGERMSIIAGHLRVASGEPAEYLAAVVGVAVRARHVAGCHDFVQSADPIDSERINIFERWEYDEALLAFRRSPSDDHESTQLPAVLDADVAKCRISTVESP